MTPPTDPEQTIDCTNLTYDKEFQIAVAPSRMSARWTNKSISVSEFATKLSNTVRTQETFAEYAKMTKADQDTIKDIGGYVGALLKGGRRTKGAVANRQLLTFDVDYGRSGTIELVKKVLKAYCYTIASTHKHTVDKPRFRLVVYPDRVMMAEEYEAVARKVAEKIDIEVFDPGSYDTNRLLFWSSASSDGDVLFYHNDATFLPVDKVLNEYGKEDGAWKDLSVWPRSSKETKSFDRLLKKQANPLGKKGIVGSYCRTVPLITALSEELGDIYKESRPGRYSYVDGSGSNGLVIYGDLAYSNHQSDPASGQCCNAFDLVRLHKFGDLDNDIRPGISGTKLPSFIAMDEYAREVDGVKADLIKTGIEISIDEFDTFGKSEDGEPEWLTDLQTDKNGIPKKTFYNASVIINNDPEWRGAIRFNQFSQNLEMFKDGKRIKNWEDTDTLRVRKHIGKQYIVDFSAQTANHAIEIVGNEHAYHPVREYLEGLAWDGVERVETLFIDYMGADDNVYVREVAICALTAAVSRIFQPGFKFDFAVTLVGGQGIGKTTFIRELGLGKWYGELLSFDNQKAMEQIAGKWIIELTELSATNKNELEQQKSFLSAQETRVRMSYGHHPKTFKRQQVFFGTTNLKEFLKDSTGNRRWLPIKCNVKMLDYEKLRAEIDQIWAEAYEVFWAQGHSVYLSDEAQGMAFDEQENRRESDPWEGMISAWLEEETYTDRYDTMVGSMEGATTPRDIVCIAEVWEDCLGNNRQHQSKQYDRLRIAAILDRNEEWARTKWKRSFGKRFGKQKCWENIEIAKEKVPF